jgi:hypothetical protein
LVFGLKLTLVLPIYGVKTEKLLKPLEFLDNDIQVDFPGKVINSDGLIQFVDFPRC